jgi:2-hydroxy-6-oxonona-2,4-dienedioate hydrolase
MADEGRGLDTRRRQERSHVRRSVPEHERPAASRPEPGEVEEVDAEPGTEGFDDGLPPPPRAAEPVDEQGRRPLSVEAVAHLDAADVARSLFEHDNDRLSTPRTRETKRMLERLLYRGAPVRLATRFRAVDGLRVCERYAEHEGGPLVVLVHGIGVSGRYLLPTAGRLAEQCSVHVPDLPGFGRSDPLGARPTVRRLSQLLESWLDVAGLARPDLVLANSFGCQVVVELAARRPERVGRLVLVGPTVDCRARSLARLAGRLALDAIHEPAGLFVVQAVDYTLHVFKSGVSSFVEMVRDPIEESLSRVQAPALVVRGAHDAIAPRAWAAEVASMLPRGRLVEVPGAGHAVNYNAPAALTRLTLDFLRSVDA